MRAVQPAVFLLAQMKVNKENARRWLDFIGADKYQLEDGVTDSEQLVQLCGKRCYMAFQVDLNPNLQKIRTKMIDYIDNLLKVGHGSVLEHVVFSFAIENVSRVFTAEMNRHRAGMAISEGSMRFIRMTDIPYVLPPSLRLTSEEKEFEHDWEQGEGPVLSSEHDAKGALLNKKRRSAEILAKAFEQDQVNYSELIGIWQSDLDSPKFSLKKSITSMMRRVIGIGVASGGVWTGNIRALRHIFTMRCASEAEEEIQEVATMLLMEMMKAEPLLFKDFSPDPDSGCWEPFYKKV